jgi:hypothetical protein
MRRAERGAEGARCSAESVIAIERGLYFFSFDEERGRTKTLGVSLVAVSGVHVPTDLSLLIFDAKARRNVDRAET